MSGPKTNAYVTLYLLVLVAAGVALAAPDGETKRIAALVEAAAYVAMTWVGRP